MSGLIQSVFDGLDRRLDAASRAPIALGLSGGGDSTALLRIAADWAGRRGRALLALTVDHRLNPDSAAWTAFAGAAATKAGAAWRALVWDGEKPHAGLPAAARVARHRLLADAARDAGAAVILLGHTADDVLEGEIMRAADAPRLGRLRDWAPSPVWPEGRGLFLLRPMLGVRRQALRDWLAAEGAVWLEDPANADPRFARIRARSRLKTEAAPASPSCADFAVAGAAEVRGDAAGTLRINRSSVSADQEAAIRLLSLVIVCAAGGEHPPRGDALARLAARLAAESAFVASLGGARIVANESELIIGREPGDFTRRPRPPPGVSSRNVAVWDGRFAITGAGEGLVRPLAGLAARLSAAERAGLTRLPPAARAALPVILVDEAVRLPRPFGDGPALADSLVGARFAAAAGLVRREADIKPACEGRTNMAHGLQASYVEALAPAYAGRADRE